MANAGKCCGASMSPGPSRTTGNFSQANMQAGAQAMEQHLPEVNMIRAPCPSDWPWHAMAKLEILRSWPHLNKYARMMHHMDTNQRHEDSRQMLGGSLKPAHVVRPQAVLTILSPFHPASRTADSSSWEGPGVLWVTLWTCASLVQNRSHGSAGSVQKTQKTQTRTSTSEGQAECCWLGLCRSHWWLTSWRYGI